MITGITAAEYEDNYDRIFPILHDLAQKSHGRWTAEGLQGDILRREKQVWVCENERGGWDAFVLTQIGQDTVEVVACTGTDREGWQDEFEQVLRDWGKVLGKKYMIFMARPGWWKWAKTKGYREIHREMVSEIE